jgi:type I restriction enzyme, S subunit
MKKNKEIMSEWKTYKLGDLINVKHGYAFKGEFFSDEPTLDILLTPGNFKIGGGFKADKFKYYKGDYPVDYILNEGDILITMTDLSKAGDTLGYSAKIPKHSGIKYLHNQRLGLVQFKSNEIDPDFLYWVLRTKPYQFYIVGSATGSTVKHTSPTRICSYEFQAPKDIEEQQEIAQILTSLDDKIELNLQMNQTLEAMAQALFKEWFVNFNYPNFDGELENGLPKGWRMGKLSDVISFVKGKKPDDVFNEQQDGYLPQILIDTFNTGNSVFANPNRMIIASQEEMLMVMDGASSGRIEIGYSGIVGSTIAKIVLKNQFEFPLYIYFFLKSKEKDIMGNTTGSSIPHADKNKILDYDFVIPNKNTFQLFEETASSLLEKIKLNKSEIKSLTHIRDSLLPKLMTGKIEIQA